MLNKISFLALLSFHCVFISPSYSASETWQSLKAKSQNLRQSDPVFSLFKLQKSWEILAEKSPELASRELNSEIANTYSAIYPETGKMILNATPKALDNLMAALRDATRWKDWKVSRKHNNLYLNVPEESLRPDEGYCGNALVEIATDPERLKQFNAGAALRQAEFKEKQSLLPIVISPSDAKYNDLLKAISGLKNGQTKAVRFNLNPFVPKQFQKVSYPLI